ncbi:hypothetical protein Mapa_014778 [Marchantia paleacea]|nr:hypothetical protein Mapa_014778 [Marchantia paleacea]
MLKLTQNPLLPRAKSQSCFHFIYYNILFRNNIQIILFSNAERQSSAEFYLLSFSWKGVQCSPLDRV